MPQNWKQKQPDHGIIKKCETLQSTKSADLWMSNKNGENYGSTPSLLSLQRGLFFARREVKGLKQREPARSLKGVWHW